MVANDATVKAGSWWPETITKILRAQEIAMRCRVPIVYLVDSAGVNLPYQGGVFPGQYGAARIFYYNSIMRRYLQRAADRRGDGPVHRRRRLPARALRRHPDGGGHLLHGARRAQPGEGRHRPEHRRRDARAAPTPTTPSPAWRTTACPTTARASRASASCVAELPRHEPALRVGGAPPARPPGARPLRPAPRRPPPALRHARACCAASSTTASSTSSRPTTRPRCSAAPPASRACPSA